MSAASSPPWECPCPGNIIWTKLRTEFLTSVRVTSVRVGLPGSGKQAGNGLKKLIAESCADATPPQFWLDYFELFDIMEEKQSHIVQPVLKEKINIFRCLSNSGGQDDVDVELLHWFLAILVKMIHHDNRDIVREGFLRFLALGESQIHPNVQELLLDFLHEQIFPILKDHVGWIFSEPEKYFEATTKFGVFIRNIYHRNPESTQIAFNNESEEIQIIVIILRFLVQDGICRSPAAGYFVVKSLGIAVSDGEVLKCGMSITSWNLSLLEECCFLLSKTVGQGLTAVDLFLRQEIELILLNIFANRIIPILNAIEKENDSLPMKNLELYCGSMLQNILGFCGTLPLEILINRVKTDSKCFLWFDTKFRHFLPSLYIPCETDCSRLQILNGVQLKGFARMVWLSVGEKNSIKLAIFNALCKELVCNFDVGDRFTLLSEALIEYQDLINEWMTTKSESLSLAADLDSALIQSCTDAQEQFTQNLSLLPQNINKELFVQKYLSFALLEVLLKSYSTAIITDESLLQNFFEGLGPNSALDNISSSNYAEFLVWKILTVLPSMPSIKVTNVRSILLNLFLKETSTLIKEEWLVNGVDLRTEFYQVKFNGLSSIFASYGNETENGRDLLHQNMNKSIWKDLLSRIITDMDKGGFGGVTSATKCVREMVDCLRRCDMNLLVIFRNDAETMDTLKDFIHLAWNLVFEMRKTESFWTALEEFVLLIAHPCLDGHELLITYSDKCFKAGETVMGLPLLLMQSLSHTVTIYSEVTEGTKLNSESSMYQEIIRICLTASLSGLSLPKNLRVTFGLWGYLLQKTENDANRESLTNCIFAKPPMVRLTALSILQALFEKLDNPVLKSFYMERILNFYLDQNDKDLNKRYFANSPIHRKRLRLGQALLVFQPHFNEEQSGVLLNRMLASLSDDNLQPSIRYVAEWIIVRVLVQHNSTWESFFNTCVEYWTNRIGFASRFASICLHATRIILYHTKDPNRYFVENALLYLTQLAVGHHVTVRAYAQTCFQKVYESLQCSNQFPELISKYEVVFISLRAADKFCIGSAAKILSAIENDFYIQLFDPVTHYSIEVIFIYLPRISETSNDELPIQWCLSNCGINITTQKGLSNQFGILTCLPREELKELYLTHCKTAWHLRTTPVGGRELGELTIEIDPEQEMCKSPPVLTQSVNFQKKVNPWKTLSVADSLMDSMKEECIVKKRAAVEDGLIVVASLVDRTPNLGGLCRSCEIFGVSKYVIPSLNILNDQQFQNLSVSSHTWVDIVEVPPKDLHLFISTYKLKGYRILGIEQAQLSTRLNDFVFPRKSMLILGNERFGIPSELLPLLDVCLEVPQVGVIRSLNVHVTGALAIWQYCCQQTFKC